MRTSDYTYRELLGITGFRNLFVGQAISQLGDALYYLVFLFMVEKLTGDAKMVGLAGVAQTLPFLLFSLHAGVLADRMDRRVILLFADIASTIVLLAFAAVVWLDPTPPAWSLIATGALLSCVNVVFAPAKSAAIPNLVPESALNAANSLSMTVQSIMPLLGIGISGTLLAALYAIAPSYFFLAAVVLNALSFAISALYIARLPRLQPGVVASEAGESRASANAAVSVTASVPPNVWREMRDGLAYLRKKHVLLVLVILSALVSFAIAPFMVVYVKVNSAWFGGEYGTLALCEGSFFVGMIISGVFVGRANIQRPGLAWIWGIALIGVTVIFMAYSRNVWAFAFWNLIAGLGLPLASIPIMTYQQAVTDDAFRGRINSLVTMTNMGVQPLAIGLGGFALDKFGAFGMLWAMGAGMTLFALLGFADRPFRDAAMPEFAASESAAPVALSAALPTTVAH